MAMILQGRKAMVTMKGSGTIRMESNESFRYFCCTEKVNDFSDGILVNRMSNIGIHFLIKNMKDYTVKQEKARMEVKFSK